MTTILDRKIDIVVQSRYPRVLEEFKVGFLETTKNFTDLRLHILDGKDYGAKEINKILIPCLQEKREFFGVLNDDLWFSEGWLESVIEKLDDYVCLSPGYVETHDKEIFKKAVELTKQEEGVVEFLYGGILIFDNRTFRRIGIYDERFDWSIDDFDWMIRIKQSRMKSGTLKRITIGHPAGTSLTRNPKTAREWRTISKKSKQSFCDKHGYLTFREITPLYKINHSYFTQFK